MNKPPYGFNIEIHEEQAEIIIGLYNAQQFDQKSEIEVYTAICEILYLDGFRAFLDRMHNQETGVYFDWDKLMSLNPLLISKCFGFLRKK